MELPRSMMAGGRGKNFFALLCNEMNLKLKQGGKFTSLRVNSPEGYQHGKVGVNQESLGCRLVPEKGLWEMEQLKMSTETECDELESRHKRLNFHRDKIL